MQQLDQGIGGILFCTNEQGIMHGILTDGDVRRALLKGATLGENVETIMNRNFTSGSVDDTHEENLQLLGPVIRHIPILNQEGKPIDMLSWSDLWRLPITTPSLAGNELKYVADCIETVWISSQGDYINKFQDAFSGYHKDGMALCTSSGTTALHLVLVALGIGPGDEVIIPNITFGASANVVLHTGAQPIFVDIDRKTRTIDINQMHKALTSRTKAIMPVHLYGHPCDMDPIMAFAKQHNLRVIEDCAEALGSEYKGQKVGLFGDAGCFSFFANKTITTGEGGMVLTNNPELLERMTMYRDHGMSKERRYWHLVPGYNYRMTNLQAAIGLAQMERIEYFLNQRDLVVSIYNNFMNEISGLIPPYSAPWARNIHWLYSIEVEPDSLGLSRDELAIRMQENGVETRPVFPSLHTQPAYKGQSGCFPISEHFAANGLSLPTGNTLTQQDTERVCETMKLVLKQ